jgi:hypothetical protein
MTLMPGALAGQAKTKTSKWLKRKTIEHVRIATLRPHNKNARTHSAQQIKQIARSIDRFGFNNPVLVDQDNNIIAGHGRVAAAKMLGQEVVPTLRIEHLSEEEKRAFIITSTSSSSQTEASGPYLFVWSRMSFEAVENYACGPTSSGHGRRLQ